jgi:prepilin-type N-terminal cleavage/methylation domain-containing protein
MLKTRAQGGFTLVEALISLVIIAIAAAGILTSFVAAKQFIEHSGRRQISTNFVRQQVEQIKASIRQDKWEIDPPALPSCDPDLNALVLTATLTCAGSDPGWTGWKNVPGEFGNPATWNGQRRYRVTTPSSGDYRVAETQIKWRAVN